MSEPTDNLPESSPQEADAQEVLGDWHRQTEEARALIARLTERLRKRDRRIALLETALARTVLMHHVWASHLERKLERTPASASTQTGVQGLSEGARSSAPVPDDPTRGVIVHLPHLTRTFEALFDVMHEFWSEWDPERPPKSSTVARAIDERLGLKPQANGEASRSAQTFAAALRPDSVNELDGRHR